MKKIIIIIIALLPTMIINAQQITKQRAKTIILELYSDTVYNNYSIYQESNISISNEAVRSLYDTVISISNDSWIFFVDEMPNENWEHSCKFVILNANNGEINIIAKKMPPFDFNSYELIKETTLIRSDDIPIIQKTKTTTSLQCPNNEHQYAVIISGGVRPDMNYIRYWNDCSFMYKTLVNTYGYDPSHIYVLMSDGTNPAADRLKLNGTYDSSPLDLDGNGTPDIQYAATKANLETVFGNLSSILGGDDNLFIYTMDHGGYDEATNSSYICLWGNNNKITDVEFAQLLNGINSDCMINIVMGQCNGGGFADDLNTSQNRQLTFAATEDEGSISLQGNQYDYFVYYFTSALNGQTPYGQSVYNIVDANADGEISMREAFSYALNNETALEHPFQRAVNDSLKNVLTLCNKNVFDLYIKDTPNDFGVEPNNNSEYYYISNDIWIRNQADGIYSDETQNPEANQKVFVYVRVHNRSYIKATGSEHLKLYWAKAGLGLDWPNSWNGSIISPVLMGDVIGDKLIAYTLPAGYSHIYEFTWNVPNPNDYVSITDEPWHFCLLAKIDADNDPMDVTEGSELWRNVAYNNNIAWKNVSVVAEKEGGRSTFVSVVNRRNYKLNGRLLFKSPILEKKPLITDEAEVLIKLDDNLYKEFLANLSSAKGLGVYNEKEKTFIVKEPDASINLILQPNELNMLGMQFNFLTQKVGDKETFKYNVSLEDRDNKEIIGGEQYVINKWDRDLFVANAGEDKVVTLGSNATLSAQSINESATYSWIDAQNDTVINGQNIEVSPLSTQKYTLSVVTEDGFTDYDSVNVIVKENYITSLSPNPANSNLTVSYEASKATTIILEVMNSLGVLVNTYTLNPLLNQYSFNVSSLPNGAYTIILNCNGVRKDAKSLIVN